MIMTVGMVIGAVAVTGYLGRKGWLAFHRAVGITPGKLEYVEPAKLPPPDLIQLNLTPEQLKLLPPIALEQIQRIDNKADVYQQWRSEAEQSGRSLSSTEDEFVIKKLLNTRLPEVINSYQNVVRHDARLEQYNQTPVHQTQSNPHQASNSTVKTDSELSDNQAQALDLLLELLMKIEAKLDSLLSRCQKEAIQEMKVMERYLEDRE